MGVYSKVRVAFKKYPLLRGMASYGVIWPLSSLIQQTFEGKNIDNYDWLRCARYGVYGSCYVAPTLYSWLTVANVIWPGQTIRAGIIKRLSKCCAMPFSVVLTKEGSSDSLCVVPDQWTFVETITYTPLAMCSFYFGMSLLEMKPLSEAIAEVEAKFWPTYKVGASIWPAVAMINFCVIRPRNRVPFISCCSLVWTCFLAYMKHLDKERVAAKAGQSPVQLLKIYKSEKSH